MKKAIAILVMAMMLVMSFAQAETYDFEGTWMHSTSGDNWKIMHILEIGPVNENGYAKAVWIMVERENEEAISVNTLNGYFYNTSNGGKIILHNESGTKMTVELTTEKNTAGYFEFKLTFDNGMASKLAFKYVSTYIEDFVSACK